MLDFGSLGLVGNLVSPSGEPVHFDAISFTLVTVLAVVLLGRRTLVAVAAAALTCAIEWKCAGPPPGDEFQVARC